MIWSPRCDQWTKRASTGPRRRRRQIPSPQLVRHIIGSNNAWLFRAAGEPFDLVLYAADLLTRREQELGDWRRVLRPVLVVFGVLGGLVYLQPDLDLSRRYVEESLRLAREAGLRSQEAQACEILGVIA